MSDSNEEEIRKATINLLSILKNAATASPTAGQGCSMSGRPASITEDQPPEPPHTTPHLSRSSVQNNMARCFPGLYQDKRRSRPPYAPKKRPGAKVTPVPFYLLHQPSERTPKLSEEHNHLLAGLGRRTVGIPEDASHKEITDVLCDVFPKMGQLEGAWMLHKAMGGSGQRKLNLVPPEEAGYTGASITKIWGGKGCIYIMPIQQTLDMTPLPFTAPEFNSMPKARCVTCNQFLPLQLLSLHTTKCTQTKNDNKSTSEDFIDLVEWDSDNDVFTDEQPMESKSTDEQQADLGSKVACPVCNELFSKEHIMTHASICGESDIQEQHGDTSEGTQQHCQSVSEILLSLKKEIDESQMFRLNITREDLFQRGMRQWSRQKKGSPKNPLSVSFIGECGIDQGALRKEFLTEMVRGIEMHLFEGESQRGKTPKYNITTFQEGHFKTCGEIFAVSLVQGGPAPNFLTAWCYNFLCHGELENCQPGEDAPADIKNLQTKVENANQEDLLEMADNIMACGYAGPLTLDRKHAIMDAIVLHGRVRLIPILNQIREGLRLYGLDKVLGQHKDLCERLFVPGFIEEVDSEFLVSALAPDLSDEGSLRRQRELKVINFLQDFLQNLEDGETDSCEHVPPRGGEDKGRPLSIKTFIQWISGHAHIPLIETEREAFKIVVNFDHDCSILHGEHSICYPVVNACASTITFPTRHLGSYTEFEQNLTTAIHFGFQFNRH